MTPPNRLFGPPEIRGVNKGEMASMGCVLVYVCVLPFNITGTIVRTAPKGRGERQGRKEPRGAGAALVSHDEEAIELGSDTGLPTLSAVY